jgi:hypothetical protein
MFQQMRHAVGGLWQRLEQNAEHHFGIGIPDREEFRTGLAVAKNSAGASTMPKRAFGYDVKCHAAWSRF